jgi:hypothetical protein
VAPKLIEFLSLDHNPHLQCAAASVLTVLASALEDRTLHLIDGALGPLVAMVDSTSLDVRHAALQALCEMFTGSNSAEFCFVVLAAGVVALLTRRVRDDLGCRGLTPGSDWRTFSAHTGATRTPYRNTPEWISPAAVSLR